MTITMVTITMVTIAIVTNLMTTITMAIINDNCHGNQSTGPYLIYSLIDLYTMNAGILRMKVTRR